jgi:hypothetical protein
MVQLIVVSDKLGIWLQSAAGFESNSSATFAQEVTYSSRPRRSSYSPLVLYFLFCSESLVWIHCFDEASLLNIVLHVINNALLQSNKLTQTQGITYSQTYTLNLWLGMEQTITKKRSCQQVPHTFYYKKIVHSSFLYRKNNKNDLEKCNSQRRNKDPNFT